MSLQETLKIQENLLEEYRENSEELEKSIAKLKAKIEEPEKNPFTYLTEGYYVDEFSYTHMSTKGLLMTPSQATAEALRKLLSNTTKIANFVYQRDPEYKPDWVEGKCYYLDYDTSTALWEIDCTDYYKQPCTQFMTREMAEELLELVNNNTITLEI